MDTYTVLKFDVSGVVVVKYTFEGEKGDIEQVVELSGVPMTSLEKLESVIVEHGKRLRPTREPKAPDPSDVVKTILGVTKDLATREAVIDVQKTP